MQMLSKSLYNVNIYIEADYNIMISHACTCIVRQSVLILYVNTRLQRNVNRFCYKIQVSVLFLNVLRDKRGRVILWKLGFFYRWRYTDGVS